MAPALAGLLVAASVLAAAPEARPPRLPGAAEHTEASMPRMAESLLAAGPFAFEENLGQHDEATLFAGQARGYTVHLEGDGLRVALHDGGGFALRFDGAQTAAVEGEAPTGVVTHHYRGADPSRWVEGARAFERVRYAGLYEGIDLVVYADRAGQLEFDVRAAPGADLSVLRLRAEGAETLAVSPDGLRLGVGGRTLSLSIPAVYHEDPARPGLRDPAQAQFVDLGKGAVGLSAPGRDLARTLVIDPVLQYATYYGGSAEDQVFDAVVVGSDVYVVGQTSSWNLPGGTGSIVGGAFDAFVAKITHAGATPSIAWRAYLGGSTGGSPLGDDRGRAICLRGGALVVAGNTQSSDFPVLAAMQGANGVVQSTSFGASWDVFLARLSTSGVLLTSTYYGGNLLDYVHDMTCDASGIYIAGSTYSSNLPGASGSPLQGSCNRSTSFTTTAGSPDLTATSPVFTPQDVGQGVSGFGIPVGTTITSYTSPTSATMSAPATFSITLTRTVGRTFAGTTTVGSATVTSATPQFIASDVGRQISGSGIPFGSAILEVQSPTSAVLTAPATFANTSTFTVGATCTSSNQEGFVARIHGSLDGVAWATYLGGSSLDRATGVAVAADGVYVTGFTSSAAGLFSSRFPGTAVRTGTVSRTAGSTAITALGSLTFSATDVGRHICGSAIPPGTTLATVTSPTTATLSAPATFTTTTTATLATAGATSPIQPCYGGSTDAFLLKLNNPTASPALALQWATYLGGTSLEYDGTFLFGGSSTFTSTFTDARLHPHLVLGADGHPIVAGSTFSSNFPVTAGAFRTANAGSVELFVTKVNPTGNAISASTYFGTTSSDYLQGGVLVDASGSLWVLSTVITSLPSSVPTNRDAIATSCIGCFDLLLSRFSPNLAQLEYVTYLGTSTLDYARVLAGSGTTLHLVGATTGSSTVTPSATSAGFPLPAGSHPLNAPAGFGGSPYDALVLRLDTAGSVSFSLPVPEAPPRYVCQNQAFPATTSTTYAQPAAGHAWSGGLATVTTTPPFSPAAPRISFPFTTTATTVTLKTTHADGSVGFDRQAFTVLATGTGSTVPPTNSMGEYCSAQGSARIAGPYGLAASAPARVCVGEEVAFTGQGLWWAFPVQTYTFDFGDGLPAVTASAGATTHAYDSPATRTVTLTIKYANAPTSTTQQATRSLAAVASGSNSLGQACRPEGSVSIAGSGVGCVAFPPTLSAVSTYFSPVSSLAWSFGDGATLSPGSGEVQHAYQTPGAYLVRLDVAFANGRTANATRLVAVASGCGPPAAAADCFATLGALHVPAPGVRGNDRAFGSLFSPLGVVLDTHPAHAESLVLRPDGSFSYVPKAGFHGEDRFTYIATDGAYRSPPTTVCIRVLPPGT